MSDRRRNTELGAALTAMLDTALACDDLAWSKAVDKAGTNRPCDLAASALGRLGDLRFTPKASGGGTYERRSGAPDLDPDNEDRRLRCDHDDGLCRKDVGFECDWPPTVAERNTLAKDRRALRDLVKEGVRFVAGLSSSIRRLGEEPECTGYHSVANADSYVERAEEVLGTIFEEDNRQSAEDLLVELHEAVRTVLAEDRVPTTHAVTSLAVQAAKVRAWRNGR